MAKSSSLGFFEEFGDLRDRKGIKKIGVRALLEKGIKEQEQALSGINVVNKNGEPIRSWFRGGVFLPAIGNYSLFPKKEVECEAGKEKYMLTKFKENYEAGYFEEYIVEVEKKRQANIDNLERGRKK